MIKSARTPNGIYLNLCKQFGITPEIAPFSTLNEKWGVLESIVPEDMSMLKTKYIAIGNGGLRSSIATSNGVNGVDVQPISPVRRKIQANALYSHIPFVLRQVGNDLTAIERMRYRMRVNEVHNGVNYVAYYLRVIEDSDQKPEIQRIHYDNGEQTITAYVPDSKTLFPTYPITDNVLDGVMDEIRVQLRITFELSEEDVAEIVNAVNIRYGAPGYGMISELGLVSGADVTTNITVDGNDTTGKEVVAAQLVGSHTVGRLIELGEVAGKTHILVGGNDAMTL